MRRSKQLLGRQPLRLPSAVLEATRLGGVVSSIGASSVSAGTASLEGADTGWDSILSCHGLGICDSSDQALDGSSNHVDDAQGSSSMVSIEGVLDLTHSIEGEEGSLRTMFLRARRII
jgi:hypothetical protein